MVDTVQAGSRYEIERLEGAGLDVTPEFLNDAGSPYTPTTVETRFTNADAATHTPGDIEGWTSVAGWTPGTAIQADPSPHVALVDPTAVRERHVMEIVGDRGGVNENPLVIDIVVLNRTRRAAA